MNDTNQEILRQISEYGLTDSEVARRTNSTQPTIFRLRKGISKDCMANLRKALESLLIELKSVEKVKS